MHTFHDKEKREWQVHLDGHQLKRVQERLGVRIRDPQAVLNAAEDIALTIDILYVLCEAQCQARKMTDEDFGKSLDGDAIDEAVEAYIGEVIPFLPSTARKTVQQAMTAMKDYQTKAAAMAERKAASPAMKKLIEATLKESSQKLDSLLAGKGTGKRSGKLPAQQA